MNNKICICTTPIRPEPTNFPPFGSLAIIQALKKRQRESTFYNIDYHRYSEESLVNFFYRNQFKFVGISAVVSTAYEYTKWLAEKIKKCSPQTIIILGGNLGASAELLLRKTMVDYVVVGDGEIIINNLLDILDINTDYSKLADCKGICYLDNQDKFIFTGYGERPISSEIEWPDYSILELDGSIEHFLPFAKQEDIQDRFLDNKPIPSVNISRVATVNLTKGCVARCTFCHRWEKGYRAKPINLIKQHVNDLIHRYNVRYIDVADENFGSDRDLANEIASYFGSLGLRWRCAGVRTNAVTLNSLMHWKANGCVSVQYGVESGSQTILDVMEKKTTVSQNLDALKWTSEAGLETVVQLVIGMPGESTKTIKETISFLKEISSEIGQWRNCAPSESISINYAQALPGTPLYEWARDQGFIGQDIDSEELYLQRISDTDAYSADHFINYTGYPMLWVAMWRPWILAELDAYHYSNNVIDDDEKKISILKIIEYYLNLIFVRISKGWGKNSLIGRYIYRLNPEISSNTQKKYDYITDSGYFNIRKGVKFSPLLMNPITNKLFFPLLSIAMALERSKKFSEFSRLLYDYYRWLIFRRDNANSNLPRTSLRRVLKIAKVSSDDLMANLREGR